MQSNDRKMTFTNAQVLNDKIYVTGMMDIVYFAALKSIH